MMDNRPVTGTSSPRGRRRGARAPSVTRPRSVKRPRSVTEDAIDKIRQLILSGSLGPGDRLPKESELAAQLGLSRNSLREHVRALAQLRGLEVRHCAATYGGRP